MNSWESAKYRTFQFQAALPYYVHRALGNTFKKWENWRGSQDYNWKWDMGQKTGHPGKNGTGGNPRCMFSRCHVGNVGAMWTVGK